MHQGNHVDKEIVNAVLEGLGFDIPLGISDVPVLGNEAEPGVIKKDDSDCFVFEHNGEDYVITEEVVEVDSELYVRVQKVDLVSEEAPND